MKQAHLMIDLDFFLVELETVSLFFFIKSPMNEKKHTLKVFCIFRGKDIPNQKTMSLDSVHVLAQKSSISL